MKTIRLIAWLLAIGLWGTVRADQAVLLDPDQWRVSSNGGEATYVGPARDVVRVRLDIDRVRAHGLALGITTDATEVVVVAGPERVTFGWQSQSRATELELGSESDDFGVRLGGREAVQARGAWLRARDGSDGEVVLQFEHATFVILGTRSEGDPAWGVAGGSGAPAEGERFGVETVRGIPHLRYERSVNAARVHEAASRLVGALECHDCNGTGRFAQRRNTGRRRDAGPFVERERRTVMETCEPCAGTGYRVTEAAERTMDTFVERFVLVIPEGERYERGIKELWPGRVRAILEINPSTVRTLNDSWNRRRRDLQSVEIGTPMWLVGRIDFDRPVWLRELEDEQTRGVLIEYPRRMIALVTEPQIEHAIPGADGCLIGGLYAGVVSAPGEPVVPVLQGGFVVGR